MSAKVTGRVKWFDSKKGIGFIGLENDEREAFVHHSDVLTHNDGFKLLKENQLVRFTLQETMRGLKAVDVEAVEAIHGAN